MIRPLVREFLIAYYSWAAREMGPTHMDLPYVLHRLRDLRAERYSRPGVYRLVKEWL